MFGCSEELVAEQLERFSEGGRFLVSLPSSSPLELESESRETKLRTTKQDNFITTIFWKMILLNFRPEELSEVARSLATTSNRATFKLRL